MPRNTKYLRGLDDALVSMRKLRQDTAPALVTALNKGVEEIAGRARVLTPSKRLKKDGIKTDFAAIDNKAGFLGFGAVRGRLRARVYVPNNPYFWARFLEFGTAPKFRKFKKRRGGMDHKGTAAQPFFYPAVRGLQKRVTRRVTRALKAAAKAVANGRR